jgi:hypothetical protein
MPHAAGWRLRWIPLLAIVVSMVACGSEDAALYTANPKGYLITIDQLMVPDFTVSSPAASVNAATFAGGDSAYAAALARDGLQSAASVEYQRSDEFATANGPLDVVATVARFTSLSGATGAYTAGVRQLDARAGATPTSTGPLGDQAHAISIVKATTGGLSAVEITLLWRVGNLLNIIIARGRYGGTRLDDALILAAEQTANETGPPAT